MFKNSKVNFTDLDGEVYSVSELTSQIKSLLIKNFGLEKIWIKGEISNYRGRNSQGHIYFKIKDKKAIINAAYFSYANQRLSFDLEEGMEVFVAGKISLYEPHGSYQIIVSQIKPAGVGELFLKFEKIKKQLKTQGLFDEEHKKELPTIPEKIGIITSPTGAAIKDMLKILRERLPFIDIFIFPARVQGKDAKNDLVKALSLANKKKYSLDLIILGRGGGSIEELWPFNEEKVAKAIFKSKVPVISAVGHETDFTIADMVSDARASTPSNAAEMAVPHINDLGYRITSSIEESAASISQKLNLYKERITGYLRSPILKDPTTLITQREQLLDSRIDGLTSALKLKIESSKSRLSSIKDFFISTSKLSIKSYESKIEEMKVALRTLNPTSILSRGYSITKLKNGKVLKDSARVKKGEALEIMLHKGTIDATVEKTKK